MNSDFLEAQRKLVPEMMDLMQQRYSALKIIDMNGPIGRRQLGQVARLSEREARNVLEALRDAGLIRIEKEGASVTEEGRQMLSSLRTSMDDWSGRNTLARYLEQTIGIRKVIVVPGDSDVTSSVKAVIGKEAAEQFVTLIGDGQIVAVTGGSSVAAIPPFIGKFPEAERLRFIAARGGVGEDIGLQANVISALFAQACGATYSTFYYPETLSEEAHEVFRKEPAALEMMAQYEKTDCVLHGIGDAKKMAAMRNSSDEELELLEQGKALGEAFGYYFDENGNVVYRLRTVGIQTEQLEQVPLLIAVAGGASKAAAILAYMASAPRQTILVTDEGAAAEMQRILRKNT
ncbi:sugar-binding transcriptional regulator [Sporosarcina sp. NCCP-2222]|uniref:sugar-binding transcriptional regulator n=1 Tax=Sporosarcina sp. NCCP-2222 TaxID=2935073 RepID=UPI00208700D6|nr:sugar-binding domain-containing protein [Sporosarcina sp. NCCP-2222]GKV57045.1 sugar-binding transcriptional regulator [Sporosarcina sp. NCCP-2222]